MSAGMSSLPKPHGSIDVYGGDARVTATRSEIERVNSLLLVAEFALVRIQDLVADWQNKIDLARFALELPNLHIRITKIRHAASSAAESYFSNEVALTHRFEGVGDLVVPGLLGAFAAATLRPTLYTMPAQTAARAIPSDQLWSRGLAPSSPSPSSLQTLIDRLERLQHLKNATVRIDRLTGNRFVVYLPGTMEWPVAPGKNPADLTSNVQLMARGRLAAAELAAAKAIKAAGIGVGSKVTFVAYSQGGLVATNLASQSPSYEVTGVVTVGAPIGRNEMPGHIPVLAIENQADLVPRLDFAANPSGPHQVTAVVAEADSSADPFASHRLAHYVDAAREVQQSTDPAVTALRERLLGQIQDRGLIPSRFYELQRTG